MSRALNPPGVARLSPAPPARRHIRTFGESASAEAIELHLLARRAEIRSREAHIAWRPFDIDSGWNTTVFIKYAANDWGYRRCSWIYGPTFVPGPPDGRGTKYAHKKYPGPLSLEQAMDICHTMGEDKPMDKWLQWKATHSDVFPVAS